MISCHVSGGITRMISRLSGKDHDDQPSHLGEGPQRADRDDRTSHLLKDHSTQTGMISRLSQGRTTITISEGHISGTGPQMIGRRIS